MKPSLYTKVRGPQTKTPSLTEFGAATAKTLGTSDSLAVWEATAGESLGQPLPAPSHQAMHALEH